MNRATPVPLFNYKKRQRQALVSDPDKAVVEDGTLSSDGVNREATNPGKGRTNPDTLSFKKPPGLMDITGKFTGGAPSNGRGNSANGFGRGVNSRNSRGRGVPSAPPVGRGVPSAPPVGRGNKMMNGMSPEKGRWQQSPSSTHKTMSSGEKSCGVKGGAGDAVNHFNQNNSFVKQDKGGIGRPQMTMPRSHDNSRQFASNMHNFQGRTTNNPQHTPQHNAGRATINTPQHNAVRRGNESASAGNSAFSNIPSNRMVGGKSKSMQSGHYTNMNSTNYLQFEEGSIFDQKEPTKPEPKKKMEIKKRRNESASPSTRIFTCPIASLKSWVCTKVEAGLVMFEIYGVLNSATVKDPGGTAKEFVLRDDTDSIKCIFYEIDRELPRLTRGQVHRVVGCVDRKRGLLKVVSVRPAKKEERGVCQTASVLSQAEMEVLVNKSNEQ